MIKDPIVEEIRKYRKQHSEKYGYDLDKICVALKKREKQSNKKVVNLKPRLLVSESVSSL